MNERLKRKCGLFMQPKEKQRNLKKSQWKIFIAGVRIKTQKEMKMKRFLSIVSVFFLISAMVFAGGNSESASSSSGADGQSKPLKFAIRASQQGRAEIEGLVAMAKENGIDVEMIVFPDAAAGEADKLLIALMAGDEFDIVMTANANLNPYYDAGLMTSLDELAESAGYDIKGIFGDYPPVYDGKYYGLPAFVDIAITIYNKDLFDRAGIPYPDRDNWTWEKFIEIGQKISALGDDIYGAYNPIWAHYNYMLAMQKGASHYKEDGSSNYDDPLFKEALQFYYDLGNKYHVNPEYLVQESRQMPLEYFTSGNVGMSVAGGWTTAWLTDHAKYPRTWKAGVLPMPYPEGYPKSTSVVVSSFWIPSTSTQKDLAFKCASLFAENMYLLGAGRIPARVDLPQEEIDRYIETDLLNAFAPDGITVEDIRAMWFDPDVKVFPEKVEGPAAAEINKIFMSEGGLYGIGEQDLDTTMRNIKEKADKAIENAR